ncbi:MAG TPA: inorganic diphosphatase [Sphingobacteriaceae bacterium]|nr:inorganic diphosphatase [Sphingobacteriaceae bacterium]
MNERTDANPAGLLDDNEDLVVDVVIEIPQGSRNKYEYDPETKAMRLDRVLYTAMHYPGDYGFVPDTLAEDGDAVDVVVLISSPTFPGCRVAARIVGALLMEDEAEADIKLLGVAVGDPRLRHIRSLQDVAPHLLAEVEHFFQEYKHLEGKSTATAGWRDRVYARKILLEAYARFKN